MKTTNIDVGSKQLSAWGQKQCRSSWSSINSWSDHCLYNVISRQVHSKDAVASQFHRCHGSRNIIISNSLGYCSVWRWRCDQWRTRQLHDQQKVRYQQSKKLQI